MYTHWHKKPEKCRVLRLKYNAKLCLPSLLLQHHDCFLFTMLSKICVKKFITCRHTECEAIILDMQLRWLFLVIISFWIYGILYSLYIWSFMAKELRKWSENFCLYRNCYIDSPFCLRCLSVNFCIVFRLVITDHRLFCIYVRTAKNFTSKYKFFLAPKVLFVQIVKCYTRYKLFCVFYFVSFFLR